MSKKEYSERKARALNNKFERAEKALNELEIALSKLIEDHNFDPDYYSASV